jgi:hypothetical protein
VVPRQPSAAPFHDWNERITAECYRPNGWARIVDDHGRIVAVVDNYERLSFNVGPTLLSWLEEHATETYARILAADRTGRRAIAQAYGHAILPLCNDRDLRTQVRWGLADFRHRFGREAEGMWLPETAVDDRVLAVLAEEGVAFTILAPAQIAAIRPRGDAGGDGGWRDVGGERDTSADLPGTLRWRHPDDPVLGVDLVVYDGPLSHDVAFGNFVSQVVIDRVVGRGRAGDVVSVACDGETFGHHHAYGDRGVAHALTVQAGARGVALPRLADWLAERPPATEGRVRLSAWSCAHGVSRWLDDCGCHTGGEPGWNQRWRAPLRAAFDLVRDAAVAVFERRAPAVLRDPWAARDAYVDVVLGAVTVEQFAARHLVDGAGDDALTEALTLLESQRHALLMYTSCGWFFNDLAGLETVQIMRYAACCLDLLADLGEDPPVDAVLDALARAQSNDPDEGDGRRVWQSHVEPTRADPARVAAHLAVSELLAGGHPQAGECARLGAYEGVHDVHEAADRGGVAACAGLVSVTQRPTRRTTRWAYAAVHLGGLEVFGAVRPAADPATPAGTGAATDASTAGEATSPTGVAAAAPVAGDGPGRDGEDIAAVASAARRGDRVTALLRLVVDRFGPREFGLESVLPGVGEDLLQATAQRVADRFVAAYDQLRSDHHHTLAALALVGTPLPAELRGPVELALSRRLAAAMQACGGSTDAAVYQVVRTVVGEAREEGVHLASPEAAAALERAVGHAVADAVAAPAPGTVDAAVGMVRLVRELALDVDLDVPQERVVAALHDAQVDGADRDLLAPLACALGVALRPLALPA